MITKLPEERRPRLKRRGVARGKVAEFKGKPQPEPEKPCPCCGLYTNDEKAKQWIKRSYDQIEESKRVLEESRKFRASLRRTRNY